MAADPTDPIWNRPEPGARGASLTRDQIAQTALAIADNEGFEAVSMRRLASELGVGTMTLYHYVRNKRELLGLIEDAIMGELLLDDDELRSDDWREAVTALAVRTYETFRRHAWSFQALRGSQENGPNGMRHFEQSLRAVSGLGLEPREQLELISLIDDYVLGIVQRQADVSDMAQEGGPEAFVEQIPDRVMDYFDSLLQSGDFPHVAGLAAGGGTRQAVNLMASVFLDEGRFRRGLERLLDGVEADLSRRARQGGRRRATPGSRRRGRSRG